MTIVVTILGFMMGFLVCHLWEDKVREKTYKEILKEMNESAEIQELCEEGAEECFEYCKNDVVATEEEFNFLKDDSEIISEIMEG